MLSERQVPSFCESLPVCPQTLYATGGPWNSKVRLGGRVFAKHLLLLSAVHLVFAIEVPWYTRLALDLQNLAPAVGTAQLESEVKLKP